MANPNLEIVVDVRFRLSWLDALKLRLAGRGARDVVLAKLRATVSTAVGGR